MLPLGRQPLSKLTSFFHRTPALAVQLFERITPLWTLKRGNMHTEALVQSSNALCNSRKFSLSNTLHLPLFLHSPFSTINSMPAWRTKHLKEQLEKQLYIPFNQNQDEKKNFSYLLDQLQALSNAGWVSKESLCEHALELINNKEPLMQSRGCEIFDKIAWSKELCDSNALRAASWDVVLKRPSDHTNKDNEFKHIRYLLQDPVRGRDATRVALQILEKPDISPITQWRIASLFHCSANQESYKATIAAKKLLDIPTEIAQQGAALIFTAIIQARKSDAPTNQLACELVEKLTFGTSAESSQSEAAELLLALIQDGYALKKTRLIIIALVESKTAVLPAFDNVWTYCVKNEKHLEEMVALALKLSKDANSDRVAMGLRILEGTLSNAVGWSEALWVLHAGAAHYTNFCPSDSLSSEGTAHYTRYFNKYPQLAQPVANLCVALINLGSEQALVLARVISQGLKNASWRCGTQEYDPSYIDKKSETWLTAERLDDILSTQKPQK